jgi:3-deoxy-D-manno-octulosonic-acid transferase
LWVAGSTAPGEEEAILAAHRSVLEALPDVRLIIAPRHPERFDAVCRIIEASGLTCARRSALLAPWDGAGVLVLDTLGELAGVYSLATAAFVGGSLVPAGGHNVLEPAVAGNAIVVGPHMENFQEMADAFVAAGALVQVSTPEELGSALGELLTDGVRRRALGSAAQGLAERHRGAAERIAGRLATLSGVASPSQPGARHEGAA